MKTTMTATEATRLSKEAFERMDKTQTLLARMRMMEAEGAIVRFVKGEVLQVMADALNRQRVTITQRYRASLKRGTCALCYVA